MDTRRRVCCLSRSKQIDDYVIDIDKIIGVIISKLEHIMYGLGVSNSILRNDASMNDCEEDLCGDKACQIITARKKSVGVVVMSVFTLTSHLATVGKQRLVKYALSIGL